MTRLGRRILRIPTSFVRKVATTAHFPDAFLKALPNHVKNHEDLHKFSLDDPEEFWGNLARETITWTQSFKEVSNCDMKTGSFKWFPDGVLNASVNCLDRHMKAHPDKTALIWEKDEPDTTERMTYGELFTATNQIANVLKEEKGVKKGDVVGVYMANSPLTIATILACSRIGAIHNIIFAGFSPDALASRIQDSKAKVLITGDESRRGGKVISLKKMADEALSACPNVKNVLVMKRTGNPRVPMSPQRDEYLEDAMSRVGRVYCEPEPVNAEDPLFYLYTSGSTGKPKGLIHSTAGYLLYTSVTHKAVFDYREGDIFGCVADIGWITGHSYVLYGPLMNGGTTVLFESVPTYPDPSRYWKMVESLGITQFYGAPTAIRTLMKYDDSFVTNYDRSSLRTIGSVGEPINEEAWHWYSKKVGESRCDVVDTWWQTETGGICLSPRPSAFGAPIHPAIPMRPFFGINPVILNEKGKEIDRNGISGSLCLKSPWPGIARSIVGDHERYKKTYFSSYPGYYCTGDGAFKNESGYWEITGRVDDVINVTGHRLGTAEVEDIMTSLESIAEAAVVGFPNEIKGEGVYAYIVLKDKTTSSCPSFEKEVKDIVKKKISGFAVPDKIQICEDLPKTRSGKIMRRILRKIAKGDVKDLGDLTTLSDPNVLEDIIQKRL